MKEEEMLMVEKNFKSLSEEVEEQRYMMKMLRSKYKESVTEIRDLGAEHFEEKEYLLGNLRDMEKEVDLLKQILNKGFFHEELEKIKAKSKYDEDQKTWSVPDFMFSQKLTLGRSSNEKDGTTLEFINHKSHGRVPRPVGSSANKPRIREISAEGGPSIYKLRKMKLADFADEKNLPSRSDFDFSNQNSANISVFPNSSSPSKYKLKKRSSAMKLKPLKSYKKIKHLENKLKI